MADLDIKAIHTNVYPSIDPSNFPNTLSGKIAFITGAGRGIGRAIAIAFAQAGVKGLALLARSTGELEETAELCKKEREVQVCICTADAAKTSELDAAVDKAVKELGEIDILVNNAGANRLRPFHMTPPDEWWSILEVNLHNPAHLMSRVINPMRARNSGQYIINISSRAAVMASRGFASSYTSSKTALTRMTACVQAELTMDNIDRVCCFSLHPGGPKTKMNYGLVEPDVDAAYPGMHERVRKFVDIQEDTVELCAWTVVYLCSGKADKLRGRYFDVEQDVGAVMQHEEEVLRDNRGDLKVDMAGDWTYLTSSTNQMKH
ncbi:NADP-binding protein [Dacryopinax primogenitus]|uniref:NADP-binding protein n=1 Tax=Dacryopinax primogenitus (strain DJM 731) TaxID=1858805 RepID=M5FPZ1_DACPD|nr:NADP-binding protein [Dacryopinax primogenitus]EJT97428.1 NADP-binding protein [Dacryopinax primogenitus]